MKATAIKFFVRNVHGSASEIMNAREEISRGGGNYGVYWKFAEVDKKEFLEEIEADRMVCCVKTKSNKYVEVDKNNIFKFII